MTHSTCSRVACHLLFQVEGNGHGYALQGRSGDWDSPSEAEERPLEHPVVWNPLLKGEEEKMKEEVEDE